MCHRQCSVICSANGKMAIEPEAVLEAMEAQRAQCGVASVVLAEHRGAVLRQEHARREAREKARAEARERRRAGDSAAPLSPTVEQYEPAVEVVDVKIVYAD